MLHLSLLTGVVPALLLVAAAAGGAFLVTRRRGKSWWARSVPLVIGGSAIGAVLITWLVDSVWQPFTDPMPTVAVVWIGVMLAALAFLVLALRKATWRRRAGAVAATVLIAAAALNGVNQHYGYYPTVAAAVGRPPARQIPLPPKEPHPGASTGASSGASPGATTDPSPSAAGPASGEATGTTDRTAAAEAATHEASAEARAAAYANALPAPAGNAHTGAVSKVEIPGTISGFHARPAWVYLPPAYFADPRPDLPVLVLIPGQPGGPTNWMEGGQAVATLDAFAATHGGRAPIVVMPDASGSPTALQMCADSALGNVETYLAKDVPDWIVKNLQVDRNTAHWAIGGFSYGGTCALTLAVTEPHLFPTFLDISGELAPTLGNPRRTVDLAFHGDAAAYRAVQPLEILATHAGGADPANTWAGLDGTFVVGRADRKYTEVRATVTHACHDAGIAVHEFTEPGSHSWYVAAQGFRQALPHLAERMNLG